MLFKDKYALLGHIFVFITIAIWSTAFVSNKVLIAYLDPIEIMLYRFIIAYIFLLIIYPKFALPSSFKDELFFFLIGALGIFIYFLFENYALKYTQASNVGLYMSAIPILTALVSLFINKDEKFSKNLIFGFFLALGGIALILFEGREFQLRLLGDLLALGGAITFALYSALLKRIPKQYHFIVVTRKSFFYGIILMLIFYFFQNNSMHFQNLNNPLVIANLLYLALFSSGVAFLLYQAGINRIGSISASNYIYLVPLLTAITGVVVLDENITLLMIIAGILILIGLYVAQKR